jgi:hypothetical protein
MNLASRPFNISLCFSSIRLLSLPDDFAYNESARLILARSSGDKELLSLSLLSSVETDVLVSDSTFGDWLFAPPKAWKDKPKNPAKQNKKYLKKLCN